MEKNDLVKWILIVIVILVVMNYFNLGREFFSTINPDSFSKTWSGGG